MTGVGSVWRWALVIVALILLALAAQQIDWVSNLSAKPIVPVADWVGGGMDWLVKKAHIGPVTVQQITRSVAWVMNWPLSAANAVLWKGIAVTKAVKILPVPWIGIILLMTLIGQSAGGWRLALLNLSCFSYMALFGLWESSMMTFSSIIIAVPLSCLAGFAIGVAVYGRPRAVAATMVILDFMQTVPIFAYLLPILFLFGFSPVSAMLGTMIYAMPAMVRTTLLAFQTTPPELIELGRITGATARQMIAKILVPSSTPLLSVGVNQVIVLSLNAVIIASIIGAGGLGFDVLKALRTLNVGKGFEAGLAIVLMAICLDRLSSAWAEKAEGGVRRNRLSRRTWMLGFTAIVLLMAISYVWPFARALPAGEQFSIAPYVASVLDYITINYADSIETLTGHLYLNVLNPFRDFLVGLPWAFVITSLTALAWRLGGVKLACIVAAMLGFILLTGFWRVSMITIYLIGISVFLAGLLGLPLGILAALNDRFSAFMRVACDTLQTLPSFVYLVPVVMLFRVGDVPAIIAVVLYAVAPAIRYTDMGLRRVDPELLEGVKALGATRLQALFKVRLKMAVPEILLGINQTVMLAISMLVITALVGTQDLGQEVYIGLSRADTGRGLIAGTCVALLSIIFDRLIQSYAAARKRALGLD